MGFGKFPQMARFLEAPGGGGAAPDQAGDPEGLEKEPDATLTPSFSNLHLKTTICAPVQIGIRIPKECWRILVLQVLCHAQLNLMIK